MTGKGSQQDSYWAFARWCPPLLNPSIAESPLYLYHCIKQFPTVKAITISYNWLFLWNYTFYVYGLTC